MKKNFLALALMLGALLSSAAAAPKTNAFFTFCIDTHDAKKRNLEQQAEMLKELGYDGVGHLWLDNIPERLKTLDAAGLKLYQITMRVDITPGKQAYDPRFKEVMPLLKGRGVQFLLLMSGLKPSDPAGDKQAVKIVREMAEIAEPSGAQILLYPHSYMWMEKIQDAVRVANKV
jgi:sugar phosphate isomerase/epimerase